MTANFIKDGVVTVFVDSTLYSREAIFKCLYWYGNKFRTGINLANTTYEITLTPLATVVAETENFTETLEQLERDLIDFNLRDIVTRETRNVRDLLIAKAFANGEFEEDPPGEITDPVGFTVKEETDD